MGIPEGFTKEEWDKISPIPKGYTKEEWEKIPDDEKLQIIIPKGIWHEEEQEEDPMDEADRRYDEWQDEQAGKQEIK